MIEIVECGQHRIVKSSVAKRRTTAERPKIGRRAGLVQRIVTVVAADRSTYVANGAGRTRRWTKHIANDGRLTVSIDRTDRIGRREQVTFERSLKGS